MIIWLLLFAIHPLRSFMGLLRFLPYLIYDKWPHKDIVQGGKLYLRRFFLSPRIKGLPRLYLHYIKESDDDRAPHDHPWWFMTIVLRGEYQERETRVHGHDAWSTYITFSKWLRPRFRRAAFLHRLVLRRPVWTLFLAGPVRRMWGFQTPEGWKPWRQYLGLPETTDDH